MDAIIQLKIDDEKCMGCGMCFGQSDFFKEKPNGHSELNNYGIITNEEYMEKVVEIQEECPGRAICHRKMTLINGERNIQNLGKSIVGTLINYRFPAPKYGKYYFTGASRQDIDGIGFYGYSSHDYSSIDSARLAGFDEMKRVIFNNIDTIAKRLLIEYKHNKLTPLLSYEEQEGNYYHDQITRIRSWIIGACKEAEALGHSIDLSIADISKYPDMGYNCKYFEEANHFEDYAYKEIQCSVESKETYKTYIEWDEYTEYIDGRWGTKTVTKYAFSCRDAVKSVMDDLEWGAKSEIGKLFYEVFDGETFRSLVKPLEEEIHSIGRKMMEILGLDYKDITGIDTLECMDTDTQFAKYCFEHEKDKDKETELFHCSATIDLNGYSSTVDYKFDLWDDGANRLDKSIEIWKDNYMDRKVVEERGVWYRYKSHRDVIYSIDDDDTPGVFWLDLMSGEKALLPQIDNCYISVVAVKNDNIVCLYSDGIIRVYDRDLKQKYSKKIDAKFGFGYKDELIQYADEMYYINCKWGMMGCRDKGKIYRICIEQADVKEIAEYDNCYAFFDGYVFYIRDDSFGSSKALYIYKYDVAKEKASEIGKLKRKGSFLYSKPTLCIEDNELIYKDKALEPEVFVYKINQ